MREISTVSTFLAALLALNAELPAVALAQATKGVPKSPSRSPASPGRLPPSRPLPPIAPDPDSGKVNLNTAGLEAMQNLPGVGAAMGAMIMAGRPYETFDDLARQNVPLSTIEQIRPLVTLGPLVPRTAPAMNRLYRPGEPARRRPTTAVDLNTATEAQLENVLGVDSSMAHWIVADRPYSSVNDLTAAGIPQTTINRILLLMYARQVTVGSPIDLESR